MVPSSLNLAPLRRKVCVHPSSATLNERCREALERLVPVRIVDFTPDEAREAVGVLSVSGDDAELPRLLAAGLPCFHLSAAPGATRKLPDGMVRFSRTPYLDSRLSGRKLRHQGLRTFPSVAVQPGDEVLAYWEDDPVWVVRRTRHPALEILSVPLAAWAETALLYDVLNPQEYLPWLPLLHFLRRVAWRGEYRRPPLRACLMIEEPNLHWESYGFISYPELLRRAEKDNYHVAFATIPFDAWYAHRGAAAIFREHPDRLSLLFHGNDHLRAELGQPWSADEYVRLLAQGLRRIARLEAGTGIRVARAMAPPQGACSRGALSALQILGFEGAFLSPGSLRNGNPGHPWRASFGVELADLMERRFPVIACFPMAPSCEAAIVFAAFLDQPIIPVGSHGSLAGGPELLSELARIINSLGDIQWGGPELMLRTNFVGRLDDETLWLDPYSYRVSGRIPAGIRFVGVEAGLANAAGFQLVLGQNAAGAVTPGEPVALGTAGDLELRTQVGDAADYRAVAPVRPSAWAISRRILSEGRDRALPMIPGFLRGK